MKTIFRKLGIDKAVAFTLLSRIWTAISGLITLYFVSSWLTGEEQGFYYTFSSILGLQVVFELGLSFVILQFSSHEMARMKFNRIGILVGDKEAKSRLRSLFLLVLRWYGIISLLIILLILPLGWIFFSQNQEKYVVVWHASWCLLVFGSALNVLIVPIIAILEGCGEVVDVAKLRLTQAFFGSVLMWTLLINGEGLNAAPLMNLLVFVIAVFWIWFRYRFFIIDLIAESSLGPALNWKNEIWPFQWRVALSWLSGYLMLQLFVPILFSSKGPVAAGQMGLSLAIAATIISVSIAWVNTKSPLFGNLVALKEYRKLDEIFFRALRQSAAVVSLSAISITIIAFFLMYLRSPLVLRMLPILPFLLLMLSSIVNNIVFAQSIYLRAFKDEGFMWIYIFYGLFVSIGSFLIAPYWGALGMMAVYFSGALLIGLGLGSIFFRNKRSFLQR